jgi:hypothetical protein
VSAGAGSKRLCEVLLLRSSHVAWHARGQCYVVRPPAGALPRAGSVAGTLEAVRGRRALPCCLPLPAGPKRRTLGSAVHSGSPAREASGGARAGRQVRPAPGRVALMDADIAHRISPPSALAGQPRYSLVWKLVFFPVERPGRAPPESTLARPEWGPPTRLGSSAGHPVPARGGDQDSAERRHVL